MASYRLKDGRMSYCRTPKQVDTKILDAATYPHINVKTTRAEFLAKRAAAAGAEQMGEDGSADDEEEEAEGAAGELADNEVAAASFEEDDDDDESAYGQQLSMCSIES